MSETDDDLTHTVRSLYEEFPFPNTEYQVPVHGFAGYFARQARGGRSRLAEGIDVIDCGCGTAAFISRLAAAFPESRFTGVDMTHASLESARAKAASRGIHNLTFTEANLLSLDLGRKFDVVMCMGVLHHLADVDRGLANLVAHVAEGGYLVLWLYGKHGRYRLNLNQQMIAKLARPEEGWRERVELAKRALRGFPAPMIACHFSVADQKIEDDFPRAREWILEHDQWIADQFVHPLEKVVDMADILALLDRHGMRLEEWFGVDTRSASYTSDAELAARIDALPHEDRLRFLDLLVKPNYYFLVARRR